MDKLAGLFMGAMGLMLLLMIVVTVVSTVLSVGSLRFAAGKWSWMRTSVAEKLPLWACLCIAFLELFLVVFVPVLGYACIILGILSGPATWLYVALTGRRHQPPTP